MPDHPPSRQFGATRVALVQGDITTQDVDAIVNAANTSLLGGGGVDGAIHRRGGPEILEQCKEIRAAQGGCPTGQAVLTAAGQLPSRYVIHTVGPVWSGGDRGEEELLRSAYQSSLTIAQNEGLRSLAFPSISTGAYRFPVDRACRIALRTVHEHLQEPGTLQEILFVLFSDADYQEYCMALAELPPGD